MATTKVSVPELQVLSIHSLDQCVLLRFSNFTKTIWSEKERGRERGGDRERGREREGERKRKRDKQRKRKREREREMNFAALRQFSGSTVHS